MESFNYLTFSSQSLNNKFTQLPVELIYTILSYDGTIIKERNNIYMKQIEKKDNRYEILLKMFKNKIIMNSLYYFTKTHIIIFDLF